MPNVPINPTHQELGTIYTVELWGRGWLGTIWAGMSLCCCTMSQGRHHIRSHGQHHIPGSGADRGAHTRSQGKHRMVMPALDPRLGTISQGQCRSLDCQCRIPTGVAPSPRTGANARMDPWPLDESLCDSSSPPASLGSSRPDLGHQLGKWFLMLLIFPTLPVPGDERGWKPVAFPGSSPSRSLRTH